MNIKYKIIRAKRKTVSIQIDYLNQITVRAPKYMTNAEVEKFVNKKQGWINKKIAANERNTLEKNQVINYKKIYVFGNLLNLEFGSENKLYPNILVVKNKNQIRDVLTQFLSSLFLSEYEKICSACNLQARSVSFKSYKSRWGCCDGKNNIIFNYKLFMLPISCWYYVIIHELCHTVHHNHSKDFWTLVSKFCKDYKKEIKILKQFSFIVKVYS